MQFVRANAVRCVIGGMLMAFAYCFILVWTPYERERGIARKIEAMGGNAEFQFLGPKWIPLNFRDRMPWLRRITRVELQWKTISPEMGNDIGTLINLEWLSLSNSEIHDDSLKYFSTLRNLDDLNLDATQISDAGLEHLGGLSDLTSLSLEFTPTTEEGRKRLRARLPRCTISPDP